MNEKNEKKNENPEFEVKDVKKDFNNLVQAVKDLPLDTEMTIKVSDPKFQKKVFKAMGIDEDNVYPVEDGDHDSIINALASINDIEIYNSHLMLEKKGFIELSKKLEKVMDLIIEVFEELKAKKVDYRIGV
ncbi:MAG: hypothetical protein ACFFDB_00055 [Promethearchaeota archaeon]